MPSASELLCSQIQYTNWANERVLSAASSLTSEELAHDFKSSDKSVLGTLVHIYRAERLWLLRMKGEPAKFKVDGDDTLAALSTNWPAVGKGWSDWAANLSDGSVAASVNWTDPKGTAWSHPVWSTVLHVVNHSTHHRGQAIGFIRALGHTPPNVDLFNFSREQRKTTA